MKLLLVIALRDIKALLLTPIFYVLSGLCTAVWSLSYIKKTIDFAYASTSPGASTGQTFNFFDTIIVNHISMINILLIFVIPAITMKLISEEKKLKTIQLLLTSPVSSTQITLAKFIAGVFSMLLLVTLAFAYPLGSLFFVELDLGLLLSSYLGLVLLGVAYVAMGLFASSLSSSQVLSLIIAVSFNLFLWLLSEGTIYSDNHLLVSVLSHISVGENLFSLVNGSLSLSTVVYFLSLTSLFIFLTEKSMDSTRWR